MKRPLSVLGCGQRRHDSLGLVAVAVVVAVVGADVVVAVAIAAIVVTVAGADIAVSIAAAGVVVAVEGADISAAVVGAGVAQPIEGTDVSAAAIERTEIGPRIGIAHGIAIGISV